MTHYYCHCCGFSSFLVLPIDTLTKIIFLYQSNFSQSATPSLDLEKWIRRAGVFETDLSSNPMSDICRTQTSKWDMGGRGELGSPVHGTDNPFTISKVSTQWFNISSSGGWRAGVYALFFV